MGLRRWEEDPLQRVRATKMQKEQTFEIYGTDAFGHFVCDGGEWEGKEMRGGGHGKVVQVMRSRECIQLYGVDRCMGKEGGEERCRGRDARFWVDSIYWKAVDGRDQTRKRRRIVGTR